MADRIAVMDAGRIVQVGTPSEIYEAPASRFVAQFLGDVNLLEGRVRGRHGDAWAVEAAAAPHGLIVESADPALAAGDAVAVAVRPEKMTLHRERPPGARNVLAGEVADTSYLGDWTMVRVSLDTGEILRVSRQNATRGGAATVARGERTYVSFAPDAAVVLTR